MTDKRQPGQGVVLVVANDLLDWTTTTTTLRDSGYDVVEAGSFEEARSLLLSLRPRLLISELKLGLYNGLHLALLRRSQHPTGPSIVINDSPDPVLERDAARLGCPYLLKPIDPQRLLNAVAVLLDAVQQEESADRRQWPRTEVAGRLALMVAHTQAHVIDVSYGGCRLQFPRHADVAQSLRLPVPASDVIVDGTLVWSDSTPREEIYGVGIHGSDSALRAWRGFVDRMTPMT